MYLTKSEKQRTERQNKALHLLFEMIAQELNDAGLDMRVVLKPEVDIPWTKQSIKDHLWRPVQELLVNKHSTKDLTTKEIDQVFDVVNRHLAKHGVTMDFPSVEEIMNRVYGEKRKPKTKDL